MAYLLDTNACIRFLNRSSAPLVARVKACVPDDIRLSAIVKAELVYGAHRSTRAAENLRLLARFFEPFTAVPFDDRCLVSYGRIRSDLERLGTPIGPNDLLIAATSIAHGLTLVTHNIEEFGRIPGLVIEDWEGGGAAPAVPLTSGASS